MSVLRAKLNEYILNKYPNRSPKILLQLRRINHSDYVYEVQGVQDLWELWSYQQAKIDEALDLLERHDRYIPLSLRHVVDEVLGGGDQKAFLGEIACNYDSYAPMKSKL